MDVYDNGSMSIFLYNGTSWANNIYGTNAKGTTLCIGSGTMYNIGGNSTWSATGGTNATAVSNTVDVSGLEITSSWVMGSGITVTQTTTYVTGDSFYTIKWDVENGTGDPLNDVRLINGQDTYLYGSDSGKGWWDSAKGTGNGSVGVTHPTNGNTMWFQSVSGSESAFHTSQAYSTARIEANGCRLSNTINTSNHDNGYAMEWDKASIPDGGTWSITVEEHVTIPFPVITSISPDNGLISGGTNVTITGKNFLETTIFSFGGIEAECTFVSSTTMTCITPPNIKGAVDVVAENPGPFVATLPAGYTYTVPTIPKTGFAMGVITSLPEQPAQKAYQNSGIVLQIPSINVKTEIVDVPESKGNYDVTWLGRNAGHLSGSTFPTWKGNSVLTGHVWDANNQPGVFADLRKLQVNDLVEIAAWGQVYTYKIIDTRNIWPDQSNMVFTKMSDASYITLMTCELFNPLTNGYTFRRMVRAVFVGISQAH